ncbi:Glycogen phosphorylase, partial [termite gut metagenome]
MKVKVTHVNVPDWKEITVQSHFPQKLQKLSEIAHNLWWSWNYEATELFRSLDADIWKQVNHNPVLLLQRLSYKKLTELAENEDILQKLDAIYAKFDNYMNVKPDATRPSVAYFSMEYGLNSVLKIYSGGLGVLAGDYLKEASDSNVDLCALGFLYR